MSLEESIYFENFPMEPRKGDRRRLEILQAAIHLIATDGYDSAVLANVAKKLGTRRSHVIYYFKTREELLMGALQFVTAIAQKVTVERVASAVSPLDKILAISDGAFEWAQQFPEQAKFMLLFYYLCSHDKEFAHVHRQVRDAGFQRMRALLATILPNGAGVLGLDGLAESIASHLDGSFIERLTTGRANLATAQELSRTACREWVQLLK